MDPFEARRQRLFEICAARTLPRLDRREGLVPAPAQAHPAGPHSRSGGWDIRASAELAAALPHVAQPDLAWKVLDRVLDFQDRDPRSFTYGNFFWYSTWQTALDPNAVSFIVPKLAHLYRRFGQAMPEALRRRLAESLALSLTGLDAHRCTWGYTNITLLNIASKLLIGDALDDPRATRIAYWDWEEWRNHTARIGMVTEYNSLCYSFVQLDALALMLTCRAVPAFRTEVRTVLRHLLTAIMLDFHPAVGRITGPQSRAYPADRRLRDRSGMQTVLYLAFGHPLPEGVGQMWLGDAIGPDDLLPAARDLPLPRTTRARTYGFTRTNYLAPDFALGSIDGEARWVGHAVPFFLAYRSAGPRCTIPVCPDGLVHSHHACQRGGSLLAACTWLYDRTARPAEARAGWPARFSGLNTGRPDDLSSDPAASARLTLELGPADSVRLVDAHGRPVPITAGPLPGTALALETDSVRVFFRFFSSAPDGLHLALALAPDAEVVLEVDASRDGRPVSDREVMLLAGLFLHVEPRAPDADLAAFHTRLAQAPLRLETTPRAWSVSVDRGLESLRLDVPAELPLFYSTEGLSVTPNQWAVTLAEGL